MKSVSCNLCGGTDTDLVYTSKDRLHGKKGLFKIVKCRQCGLVYVNPRPTEKEIKDYYPEKEYYSYVLALGESRELDKELTSVFQGRLEKIFLLGKTKGRLLDVGCGNGSFLKFMQDHGWAPMGIELSDHVSAFARERFGLNVFSGQLNQIKFPEEYFDVITMYAVIEHCPNPMELLVEASRILKPEGLLVITTQNISSLESKFFRKRWFHLDVPRHLYDFSDKTLTMLLEKAGYKILKLGFFPAGGIVSSLKYIGKEAHLSSSKKLSFMNHVFSIVKISVEIYYFIMQRLTNGGEAIEVFAIKSTATFKKMRRR